MQNFISHSPWDEQRLWRHHWTHVARHACEGESAFVIDDGTFVKRGQRSVGVQRQYSSELRKKVNCQIAVAVHCCRGGRLWPLALRLYLPRSWTKELTRLRAAGVPPAFAAARGKVQVALELLDQLLAEGLLAPHVVSGEPYDSSHEFRVGLRTRGLNYVTVPPPSSNQPGTRWPEHALQQARQTCRRLKDELGLDHFEGRSWRGFHHHACLVVLAYCFLLEQNCPARRGTLA